MRLARTPGRPGESFMTIGRQGKSGASCRTFDQDGTPITGDRAIAGSFCDYYGSVGSGMALKVRISSSGSIMAFFLLS